MEMDLHTVNKMLMGQLPALDSKRVSDLILSIAQLPVVGDKYFMLLSAERSDYTVFAFQDALNTNLFADEVMSILESRGEVKEYDVKDRAIEIWVDDVFYALFPYDLGVIEL